MTTTAKEKAEVHDRLARLGVSYADACALRRISTTLHRWYELECGTGEGHVSRSVERDEDTGKTYLRVQYLTSTGYVDRRYPTPDREAGARKRLAAIMTRYSRRLVAYVQTDPRGAALYLVRRKDVPKGGDISAYYSRGTAIY